jgi:hypothetical protein
VPSGFENDYYENLAGVGMQAAVKFIATVSRRHEILKISSRGFPN